MKIALLGDIALIGKYDRTMSKDVDQRIEYIRHLVSKCDYVIGNLESPLTGATRTIACKGVYLRSDPVNVRTLKQMGITHVTIANNHIYDYGSKGVADTIRVLKKEGIGFVGLGNKPAKLVKDNERVLLDGFCCLSANAICYGNKPGKVKLLTPQSLELFLKKAQKNGYLPLASVHFGWEGVHYPSTEHLYLFREMAQKYKYLLHGNHPHAVQGYEKVNESLLLYALGNLCFDKTPVTSIKLQKQNNRNVDTESRRSYISIIEIRGNEILDNKVYPITDLETDVLHSDECLISELKDYCDILSKSYYEIKQKREKELLKQKQGAEKRSIRFVLNRLNYKYIGAYMNGRLHSRQYKYKIMDYCKIEQNEDVIS